MQKPIEDRLENTITYILKFAGFEIVRDVLVIFNEKTSEYYLVDVLAEDKDIKIFVGFKHGEKLLLDEKLTSSLLNKFDHYRKSQSKRVIWIIATTAKNHVQYKELREKLQMADSFIWNGKFAESLQSKIMEIRNKDDFRSYLLDHLEPIEVIVERDNETAFTFRFSFYTISPDEYIGKKFDIINIVDDIKYSLKDTAFRVINYNFDAILSRNGKRTITYHMKIDFRIASTPKQIKEHVKKKGGLWAKIKREDPNSVACNTYEKEIRTILSKVYGINYSSRSNILYEQIVLESRRIDNFM